MKGWDQDALRQQLAQGMMDLQQEASDQQLDQLISYLALLSKWNQAYNLTAVRDPQEMVVRHLLDSLSLLPYIAAGELLDVGSGAGLPSIPIAIMRPDLQVRSVDSNGKKVRFQVQVKAALQLDHFDVTQVRVEEHQPLAKSPQIVSRAFASLQDFIQWTEELATEDARWLAMKGQWPEEELAALPAGFALAESHSLQVPGESAQRHLLIIQRQTT
ncbi:16S rRNA (guanine(527)-N(7))-methyltransferase RsmG [Marinospirillum sp. MEB164]|uniref:Ribosomal RNA small subunit methyltransferase G n=1 Tax=Marinospirillum alkalitolerans TaxID=3123374 RepID=A0ABW8PXI8_9GAMM